MSNPVLALFSVSEIKRFSDVEPQLAASSSNPGPDQPRCFHLVTFFDFKIRILRLFRRPLIAQIRADTGDRRVSKEHERKSHSITDTEKEHSGRFACQSGVVLIV